MSPAQFAAAECANWKNSGHCIDREKRCVFLGSSPEPCGYFEASVLPIARMQTQTRKGGVTQWNGRPDTNTLRQYDRLVIQSGVGRE